MSENPVFREKIEEVVEVEKTPQSVETPNLIDEKIDGALRDADAVEESKPDSELTKWEIKNGKYGIEFFGINEIAKTFPISAQFGIIDNYIKEQITENNYDETPTRYQTILDSIEQEIGSAKLNIYDRLKRLSEYVKVMKKMEHIKKLKESYSR